MVTSSRPASRSSRYRRTASTLPSSNGWGLLHLVGRVTTTTCSGRCAPRFRERWNRIGTWSTAYLSMPADTVLEDVPEHQTAVPGHPSAMSPLAGLRLHDHHVDEAVERFEVG